MTRQRHMLELRDKLLHRRDEISQLRESIRASWGELQEPTPEFEESASKRTMAGGLEQIDDRTSEELRNIDAALAKMESGRYGECEVCGKEIGRQRLNAIPWVRQCFECAALHERISANEPEKGEEEADRMPVPLDDAELRERIWDALDSEESLQTDGLEISTVDGIVQMNGFVPDRRHHQLILEILEETLGTVDIIDNIEIESAGAEADEDEDEPV